MKSIPLLRLLVPLCVGIGVGDYAFPWLFPHTRLLLLLLLVLIVLSGCALFRRIEGKWLSFLTTTLAFSLGIVLLVHQQQERMTHYAAQNFTFRGIISEVPHRTPHGWRVTLRMRSPKTEEKWQVYLTDSTLLSENAAQTASATAPSHVSALPVLQIGQEILAHGRVTPLLSNEGRTKDHYADFLLRQNIVTTAHCFPNEWKTMGRKQHSTENKDKTSRENRTATPPLCATASSNVTNSTLLPLTLREKLLLHREQWVATFRIALPPHTAAILSAMTLAHRELLDSDTQLRYSQSGASHILALSGLHLSILFGAFSLIIGNLAMRIGRKTHLFATFFGILLIWCFAAFVGFPISLVRATLMLTLAHLFALRNHRPGALHGLFLAMLLMLLYAPDWLFDVGFQLSCAAVAGILWFSPLFSTPQWLQPVSQRASDFTGRPPTAPFIKMLMTIGRYFYTLFTVSLSAQLATAPLVAYHFHQLAWGGLIASLFVIPAAYVLLLGGIAFLLIAPLRTLLAPFLTSVITLMENGLRYFSSQVFAPLPLFPSFFTTLLSSLFIFGWGALLLSEKGKAFSFLRKISITMGGVFLLVLSYQYDRFRAHPQPSLLIYPTSGVTTLHLIAPDGHSWLFASDTLRAQAALRQVAHDDWAPQGLKIHWLPLSVLESAQLSNNKLSSSSSLSPSSSTPPSSSSTLSTTSLSSSSISSTNTSSATSAPLLAPHCIVYGGQRIAIVDSRLSYAFPQQPLPVDILLVGHDVHRPLSHLLCYYRPKILVLSAAMSDFYRRQYLSDAAHLHLACYDVQQQPLFQRRLATQSMS